jgi:hypothetical protein
MKKNVLRKGILILLVLTFLTIGLTGCGTIIPPPTTTGTVYITIGGYYTYYDYYIYMDSNPNPIGITWGGNFTVTGVTPGYHTFWAYDSSYDYYYDSDTPYVQAGSNYITLNPY